LINRLPTSTVDTTPYQLVYGVRPDLSTVRVFGSPCFVHIEDGQRTKLGDKAKVGVYVGNSTLSPSFLVFFPKTRRIVESAHVTFHERFTPASVTPSDPFEADSPTALESPDIVGPDDSGVSVLDEVVDPDGSEPGHVSADTSAIQPPVTRSSARLKDKQLTWVDEDGVTHWATSTMQQSLFQVTTDPTSIKQALESPNAPEWISSMREELDALQQNQVMVPVPESQVPSGSVVLPSKMVFRVKRRSDGTVERFKSRLVVQGFYENHGFEETFAPVTTGTSLRVFLAVSASKRFYVHQLDIANAFLNSDMHDEVYIRLPSGLPDTDNFYFSKGAVLWKLRKALYGLQRAPQLWFQTITAFLLSLGFRASAVDPCLFVQYDNGVLVTMLLLYVDDILVSSLDICKIASFKTALKTRYKFADKGVIGVYLGIQVTYEREKGMVTLSQSSFINSILAKHGFQDARPVATPMVPNTTLTFIDDDSKNLPPADHIIYREVVGSLIYLANCTRPDIAVAVSQLSRFVAAPQDSHWVAVKHLLRYLRGTRDLKLTFGNSEQSNVVKGSSDATWGSDTLNRKSVTGFAFFLNGGAISWRSKMQTTISLSSAEAEANALAAATTEAKFLRCLLNDIGCPQKTISIEMDNQPAMFMAIQPLLPAKAKHLGLKLGFIREAITNQIISVKYVPSGDLVADALTKSLEKSKLFKHRTQLLGNSNEGVC
jgi:hypothetical protein